MRRLEARQERVGAMRLLLAATVLVLPWSSWGERWLSALWMLAPVAGFVCAASYHAVLRRRHSRAVRAVEFYRHGLARLEDRWAGVGNRGERFGDVHHVYAAESMRPRVDRFP